MGFRNVKVESVSSPKAIGDLCLISCSYEYQGAATSEVLYCAIGNSGFFGFDEILHDTSTRSIPACSAWTKIWGSVLVRITAAIDPDDSPYDAYCKIGGVVSDPVKDVLYITGGTPEPPDEIFQSLIITNYSPQVDIGGVCQVTVSFQYQGPAQTLQLYAALGNSGWAGFDEILHGTGNLILAETASLQTKTATVSIPITSAIDPNQSPYDLYAKIVGKIISPTYENVVTVRGGVPSEEFKNIRITNYTTPVMHGNVCTVQVAFEYQGPALSRTLYSAIGNSGGLGFDEVAAGQAVISVPQSMSLQTFYRSVNISITTAVNPDDSPYDLYAKIVGGIISPTLFNVVVVQGIPTPPDPEFRNYRITSYTTPVGPGDVCMVRLSFEYQGPAGTAEVYAAIGNTGLWGFDEILAGQDIATLPSTLSWQSYYADIPINITSGLSEGDSPYDLYAKIQGKLTPILENVIYVKASAGDPEYQNMRITGYDSPVSPGGTCRVTVKFDYRGPVTSRTLHVAIGNNGFWGFDEIVSKDVPINLPAADTWTEQTFTATVLVGNLSVEDSPYDLYAKLDGVFPDVKAPILNDVIGIEGGGPGAGDIVGTVTSASPTTFEPGQPVQVTVKYNAYTDDQETQLAWQTRVTISAGSLHGQAEFDHFGYETSQEVKLSLGDMPEASQTGSVKLEGRKVGDDWSTLFSEAISIRIPGEEPPEGGEGMGVLGWVALAGLGLGAIAGGGEQKPVKKPATKTARTRLRLRAR